MPRPVLSALPRATPGADTHSRLTPRRCKARTTEAPLPVQCYLKENSKIQRPHRAKGFKWFLANQVQYKTLAIWLF